MLQQSIIEVISDYNMNFSDVGAIYCSQYFQDTSTILIKNFIIT